MLRIVGLGITIVVISALVFLSINYKSNIIHQLNIWKLLPEPESFTELYFDNHQELPSIIKDDKTYTFRFITHNLEHKPITYKYEVTLASDSAQLLKKGTFTLENGQSTRISVKVPLYVSIPKSKIEVNLVNKNQKIHFWVVGLYQDNGKSNSNNSLPQ